LKAAKLLDIDVIIATSHEQSLVTEIKAGINIDLNDLANALESILVEHRKRAFQGIIGTDDSTVEIATYFADHLKLRHNPVAATKLTHRKDLARICLKNSQCAVPKFKIIDLKSSLEAQTNNIHWPCVLKPLNMSASRGVIRVNNLAEFVAAGKRIGKIVRENHNEFERQHLLLESYIEGIEVAYEGYLENGKLNTVTLFDKPNPLQGPYFEETIYVTPSTLAANTQNKIKTTVESACQAYGLVTGPIHAELRIDQQGLPWTLEVANRSIGGDCARTLDAAEDYALEKMIISLAIGHPVEPIKLERARGVMMIPTSKTGILQKINGISDAESVTGINSVIININPGYELIALPEGNQYLGYLFAEAETPDQVVNTLNLALSKLEFKVQPKISLLPSNPAT